MDLLQWLRDLGWVGEVKERAEVGTWLTVWNCERVLQRRRALPRAAVGPSAWRPPLAPAFAIGRLLYARRCTRPHRLMDEHGAWQEGLGALEELLWRNREPIWATCPAFPAGAAAMLDSYFVGRTAAFPAAPEPRLGRMLTLVLPRLARRPVPTMSLTSSTPLARTSLPTSSARPCVP